MPPEIWSARFGSPGTGDPASGAPSAQTGAFRKEGEYWTAGYGGKTSRLKDSKGLGDPAHLLRHPSVEFHVLDLAGGDASQGDGDATKQSPHRLPRAAQGL